MSAKWSYEEAVQNLMLLQSSRSIRERVAKERAAGKILIDTTVEDMEMFLEKTGLPLTKLDELSVIHVAGTKGKGSTCAMVESILRHHGLRTGFFSGPHLVQPRERIRLNGHLLPEDRFAAHAQRIFTRLRDAQENDSKTPSFFSFMTVMAFHVFLEEQVDVAIIEVGCGGIHDATNVLRKVAVVGITSLELDHTDVLGNSLGEVAAAKAGILKRGCVAYSAPQRLAAWGVLVARARLLRCALHKAPPLSTRLALPARVPTYRTNASLAVQLAHAWLRSARPGWSSQELPQKTLTGLTSFRWPGRYHVLDAHHVTFYLDGAHTDDSISVCAQWFTDSCDSATDKILLYTNTPERNVAKQLQCLAEIPFKRVFFVSHNIYKDTLPQKERGEYKEMHERYTQHWHDCSHILHTS